jgi:hypothetical protein
LFGSVIRFDEQLPDELDELLVVVVVLELDVVADVDAAPPPPVAGPELVEVPPVPVPLVVAVVVPELVVPVAALPPWPPLPPVVVEKAWPQPISADTTSAPAAQRASPEDTREPGRMATSDLG